MLTAEERAEISRQNGAKSKGPVTEQGKANSRLNALKTGEYAQKLNLFLPLQPAVTCAEDRAAHAALLRQLIEIYQPINQLALSIVHQISIARWQIDRLNHSLTAHWNLALLQSTQSPSTFSPELAELESLSRAATSLYGGHALALRLNRQIDQLDQRIARLERRLQFIHNHFPSPAEDHPERTHQPVENTDKETPAIQNEPTVYVTENKPDVLRAYRQQFPNSRIVVLPADHVAKGIEIPDHLPVVPRKST